MKLQIIGKGFKVSPAMKEQTAKKLERVGALLNGDPTVVVVYSVHPTNQACEITIRERKTVLRAKTRGESAYECLDLTMDKLEGQLRKVKTGVEKSKKRSSFDDLIRFDKIAEDSENGQNPLDIVRHKFLVPEHMDAEEAISRMEAIDHSFYIFIDSTSGNVCVLYRREDGGYGVIEANENE